MRTLRERLQDLTQVGRLEWIGVRPDHGAELVALHSVEVIAERGLEGDIRAVRRAGGKRQVSLIQAEHFPVVASFLQRAVTPFQTRRNLVISGINLTALGKLRFAIGEVVLVGSGPCAPCGRMEETLGAGGFQAMRGHGGIVAMVEVGGRIEIGAPVRALAPAEGPEEDG
jgi:MOSC domain-containing protein YiiM